MISQHNVQILNKCSFIILSLNNVHPGSISFIGLHFLWSKRYTNLLQLSGYIVIFILVKLIPTSKLQKNEEEFTYHNKFKGDVFGNYKMNSSTEFELYLDIVLILIMFCAKSSFLKGWCEKIVKKKWFPRRYDKQIIIKIIFTRNLKKKWFGFQVLYFGLWPGQKCYSKVMHRKEVTHSNGS